jgi:methionyl-tRNA formyltransferase
MDIIFLGSGAFGLPSLDALHQSGHRILAVVSQPDRPAGRGGKLTPTPVSTWATDHGLPLFQTEDANALVPNLAGLRPQALVVIAFGQKLSDALLNIAPHGGINLHSSLLPKYRGAAPINWAVLNHDAVTGVSMIRVTNVMDGGAILATASTEIGASETAGELHDRLALLGAPLLPKVLDQLAAGTVREIPQDVSLKSRAPKLSRAMSWIDFSQPAPMVSAWIRGLSPWPGCMATYTDAAEKNRGKMTLLKVRATTSETVHPPERQGLVLADGSVACGRGSIEILIAQPEGKKAMDAAALRNGYGHGVGGKWETVIAPPAVA